MSPARSGFSADAGWSCAAGEVIERSALLREPQTRAARAAGHRIWFGLVLGSPAPIASGASTRLGHLQPVLC